MGGQPPVLDVRDLTVRYPASERDALREVSLALQPGSFLSIAGRNGAGKSTLCLAAAGLLPRVVRADVRGSVAGPVPTGLVLADPAAGLSGARATVRDEVAFGLENLGVPREAMDARIEGALAALGMDGLPDRAPESLSGGEQQRVGIAAALAMQPPLLVLDEATAELDADGAAVLADVLARLASAGSAVLAADHLTGIHRAAGRTVVLDQGSVVAMDEPAVAIRHGALAGAAPEPVTWLPVRADVPPASVELRGVTYRYRNGVEALRDVSLSIPPGQALAIVGANGSGKSTLAKHLVGLLQPTSGTVAIDGRDLRAVTVESAARTIGFLLQDPRDQLFGRTVEQAVAFAPRNLRLADAEVQALVHAALAATGLTDRRGMNPHDLDFAARKQAALAGVLAMDPGLLVLDEPTTGQDQPGIARVEAVIQALRAAGRTIVAITHDLDLASRAFDRVVALRDGELAADA